MFPNVPFFTIYLRKIINDVLTTDTASETTLHRDVHALCVLQSRDKKKKKLVELEQ